MGPSTRASAIMPTVKCSSCSCEIEISRMGDHVCGQAPPMPKPPMDRFNNAFASLNGARSNSHVPAPFKTNRPPPPHIDSTAANRLYLRAEQAMVPSGTYSSIPGDLPSTPGQPSWFPASARSAKAPYQHRTSPDLPLPQDCAFPVFPNTPTTSAPKPNFEKRPYVENPRAQAPFSAKGPDGFLQKMGSVTPGPFSKGADYQPRRHHQRTATLGSSKDFSRPGSASSYHARPSTSGSDSTRNGDFESTIPPMPVRSPESNPRNASSPGPYRRRPSEVSSSNRRPSVSATNRPLHEIGSAAAYNSYRSAASRGTSPVKGEVGLGSGPDGRVARSRNDPRLYDAPPVPGPSYGFNAPRSASAMGDRRDLRRQDAPPLPSGMDSGVPRSASATGMRNDRRLYDAPPLPTADRAQDFGIGNPYHTSAKSTSSNGSVYSDASDMHSNSSRSSPPLSAALHEAKAKQAEVNHLDSLLDDLQATISGVSAPVLPIQQRRGQRTKSFSRPSYARQANLSLDPPMPESPMDPVMQTRTMPSTSTSDCIPTASKPFHSAGPWSRSEQPFAPSSMPTQPTSSHTPTTAFLTRPPRPGLPTRRMTTGNKGNCRGCGEIIRGKSVSSADGRLTGRYHKECFVCETCDEPFPTNDFYVIDNHPFCARHYHQLNGSLCQSCDKGIEGEYLETDMKQKFHPFCFTCRECHMTLHNDYYDVNGKTYCERHALRPELLGLGRRFPERRTTRLMMM